METIYDRLSRREREVMDVLYESGEATAAEVRDGLADPPSYSAVRATLRILEEKGVIDHRRDGRRYVFAPKSSRKSVRKRVLGKIVRTFFEGSPEKAIAALLDLSAKDLSPEDLDRLSKLVDDAKREGR
jgi:predicted transcriptional regulator